MYIIVNNTPINIYYSSISNIYKLCINNLRSICDSIINPDGSGKYVLSRYKRIGEIIYKRKWITFDEIDYKTYSEGIQKETDYHNSELFRQSNYDKDKFFKVNIKDGYFFYIEDNMHIVVSELYKTKEAADNALNKIISKINEITANDIKVNI